MQVYNKNNSRQYNMIVGRELMQELAIYIKFSGCKIRGRFPGPFQGCYTPMKDFKELIYTYTNYEIISDKIYGV